MADETGFLQYGIQDETSFTTFQIDPPAPSSMKNWPNEKGSDKEYKITSAWITLSMDQIVVERQTYSILEWLGDVGGLFDMLGLIGGGLVAPFSAFAVKAEMMTSAFRYTQSLVFAENH